MPKVQPVRARNLATGEVVGEWATGAEAALACGCSPSAISVAVRAGMPFTAGGYAWERAPRPPRTSRTCSRCKVELTNREFYTSGPGRLHSWCKDCQRRYSRQRYWGLDKQQ